MSSWNYDIRLIGKDGYPRLSSVYGAGSGSLVYLMSHRILTRSKEHPHGTLHPKEAAAVKVSLKRRMRERRRRRKPHIPQIYRQTYMVKWSYSDEWETLSVGFERRPR